jgi:hypothetical protein
MMDQILMPMMITTILIGINDRWHARTPFADGQGGTGEILHFRLRQWDWRGVLEGLVSYWVWLGWFSVRAWMDVDFG